MALLPGLKHITWARAQSIQDALKLERYIRGFPKHRKIEELNNIIIQKEITTMKAATTELAAVKKQIKAIESQIKKSEKELAKLKKATAKKPVKKKK